MGLSYVFNMETEVMSEISRAMFLKGEIDENCAR